MNHRERVMAAIHHQITDKIPIDAIHIENKPEVGQFLDVPAEKVLDCLDIDGRFINAEVYLGELPTRDGKTLSPWSTETELDYGTTHYYPLASATSVTEIERFAWPDPHSLILSVSFLPRTLEGRIRRLRTCLDFGPAFLHRVQPVWNGRSPGQNDLGRSSV